jgi:hypothetical protein
MAKTRQRLCCSRAGRPERPNPSRRRSLLPTLAAAPPPERAAGSSRSSWGWRRRGISLLPGVSGGRGRPRPRRTACRRGPLFALVVAGPPRSGAILAGSGGRAWWGALVRGRGGGQSWAATTAAMASRATRSALAAATSESAVVVFCSAGSWLRPARNDGGGCRRFCLFRAWAWSWRGRRIEAFTCMPCADLCATKRLLAPVCHPSKLRLLRHSIQTPSIFHR